VLEAYLKERRQKQEILLMTHIVLGHPHFDTSLRLVESMVHAGVDLIELQIPFSEPMADGPVILRANQEALSAGSTVERCFEVATEVARRFDIPFLFMSYYNVLFRRGVSQFVARAQEAGLRGAIVPDLPPEEASEYLAAMQEASLSPIFIYSPNTTDERLKVIADYGSGFVYCVARKGVTGSATLPGARARCDHVAARRWLRRERKVGRRFFAGQGRHRGRGQRNLARFGA
jgi:tryptophan synthase alpha chain